MIFERSEMNIVFHSTGDYTVRVTPAFVDRWGQEPNKPATASELSITFSGENGYIVGYNHAWRTFEGRYRQDAEFLLADMQAMANPQHAKQWGVQSSRMDTLRGTFSYDVRVQKKGR